MSEKKDLEKYFKSFFDFFPYGIAQRKVLIANAFHLTMKDTKLITVFWRFFLIINPDINGYSIDEQTWHKILSQKRSLFTNLQNLYQAQLDSKITLQSKDTWDKIVIHLASEFLLVSGKLDKDMSDELKKVLVYFINDETPDDIIELVCIIVSRIYMLYVNECEYFSKMATIYMNHDDEEFKQRYSHIYDNLNFLFSKEFLLNDLFNSIKSVLSMLAPIICATTESVKKLLYQKIIHAIRQHSPLSTIPDETEVDDILIMYKKLFFIDKSQRETMYDLFTALFAFCPQTTIFHIFHSWIYMNNISLKANNISHIQTKDWILSIGVKLKVINCLPYAKKLENVQKSFQEIKELVKSSNSDDGKLPPKIKEVVKFQLRQLTRLLHDEIYWEELIPFNVCLSKIPK